MKSKKFLVVIIINSNSNIIIINKSAYSLNLSRWASNFVTLARLRQLLGVHNIHCLAFGLKVVLVSSFQFLQLIAGDLSSNSVHCSLLVQDQNLRAETGIIEIFFPSYSNLRDHKSTF